jgi:Zn-dependent protease
MTDGVLSTPAAPGRCARCGTELASALLACPGCRALVHADALRAIAVEAEAASGAGDHATAAERWRAALALLPEGTQQHAAVRARLDETTARLAAAGSPKVRRPRGVWGTIIAALAFVLAKAKFLLLGLTKLGTLSSMLVFLGFSASHFSWGMALGVVLAIYVHEMGHVHALQRHGIAASAPMFIPGIGALVRLKEHPQDAHVDARIGLAGPLWGLGAVLVAYAAYLATGAPVWGAVAKFSAMLNLFNLLPIWQLDGGRGFRPLSRGQRWIAVGALVALFLLTQYRLLVLLAGGGVWQAFREAHPEGDRGALATYVWLAAVLTLVAMIHVPAVGIP